MTNKEILAELKIAYENLRDIRENGCSDHCNGQLDYKKINMLETMLKDISRLYYEFYRETDKQELEINYFANEEPYYCGYIADDISYDYLSYNRDDSGEEIYNTCEDIGYYWYEDKEFLNS